MDLSKDQLVSIYKGTINNWVELGGANQPIVVIDGSQVQVLGEHLKKFLISRTNVNIQMK